MRTLKLPGLFLATALFVNAAPKSDIDGALKQWLGDKPGGVAAGYVDAEGVAFFSAGQYSAADARPLNPDTEFEIGSVTKVFTALLLADAVAAEKIRLADAPGKPFAAGAITYQQLATHTSGLARLPADFPNSDPLNPYADLDLPALTKSFDAAVGTAKPTESASYSNFGFAVLGQAVAGVWSRPYGSVLTERILTPLGLNDTRVDWRAADPKRLAPPHNEQGPAKNWDMNAYAPAGSIVSTTRDLTKFLQTCLGLTKSPLDAVIAESVKPLVPDENGVRQVGLAWLVEKRGESIIIWHNGGTGGYRSFVAFDLTSRTGIVVLTNTTASVDSLGMALLAGRDLPAARTAPEASAKTKDYLGNYPLAPSFVMKITAEADTLFLQATGQPRLKLKSLAADRYGIVGVDAEVSFERDAAGKVNALVLHQGGRDQRAPRLAAGEMPAAQKEVALTEAELDDYVGTFGQGPATFTVTRNGTRLMVQLSGQGAAPVFASAKDEFFYKIVNARISFLRESGKVVSLILHQNGRDLKADRTP